MCSYGDVLKRLPIDQNSWSWILFSHLTCKRKLAPNFDMLPQEHCNSSSLLHLILSFGEIWNDFCLSLEIKRGNIFQKSYTGLELYFSLYC